MSRHDPRPKRRGKWNPVKELKDSFVEDPARDYDLMWNPVKELKGCQHMTWIIFPITPWNPVKELKDFVKASTICIFILTKWNPVKELKDLKRIMPRPETIQVESGEGIERFPRLGL